jgi:hypothetical protein
LVLIHLNDSEYVYFSFVISELLKVAENYEYVRRGKKSCYRVVIETYYDPMNILRLTIEAFIKTCVGLNVE